MRERWTHVGGLWAAGGPFLAAGAALRGAWHGLSSDDCDQVVAPGWRDTGVPVGTGRAVLAGGDGVARDDSRAGVFAAGTGAVAIVRAAGSDCPGALARALGYPAAEDQDGGPLTAGSGELAVFNAAPDGAGPCSGPVASARPGPVPLVHGPPPAREVTDPVLLLSASHTGPKLKVR